MMPALTTNIDASALRRKFEAVPAKLEKNLRIALDRTVNQAAQYARTTTLFRHVSLGLRQGIRTHFITGFGLMVGSVTSTASYSHFLEYGTQAHYVRPVRAQALRFVVNGAVCFSRGHWVRGITPRPFMHAAKVMATPLFERLTAEAFGRAFE